MRQMITCRVCGEPITAHYALFAHARCTAPPRPEDLPGGTPAVVDLEAAKRKLVQYKATIDVLRAKYYRLGPLSWRSHIAAFRPLA